MSHPQGETGLTRRDDGIALILIAESPKKVIKLAIHLGNPGLFGPAAPAPAGERDIELDRDGLELVYEAGPIRSHDPWLIDAMERADAVLAADLPPLDLGPSLGVIASCPEYLALLEKGAPPDHLVRDEHWLVKNHPERFDEKNPDYKPLTDYLQIVMGNKWLSREEQKLYLTENHFLRDYYNQCSDARLMQMAGPVSVSYFNEKFPGADIYRNYVLRMPGSWTKPLTDWEFDELVVLSDQLTFHFYDDWIYEIAFRALGDFTGDGVLDLLVDNSEIAIKGTYRSFGLALFVRNEEGGEVKFRWPEDVLFARLHPGWEHPDWAEE